MIGGAGNPWGALVPATGPNIGPGSLSKHGQWTHSAKLSPGEKMEGGNDHVCTITEGSETLNQLNKRKLVSYIKQNKKKTCPFTLSIS